jgi:hypothetical protein
MLARAPVISVRFASHAIASCTDRFDRPVDSAMSASAACARVTAAMRLPTEEQVHEKHGRLAIVPCQVGHQRVDEVRVERQGVL